MKVSLLINMKMPTIVGIFIFISREMFMLIYVSKKEFAIVSNLGFINRMLSKTEHEKRFYNLEVSMSRLTQFGF